jgi:hypothetical protein
MYCKPPSEGCCEVGGREVEFYDGLSLFPEELAGKLKRNFKK